MNWKLFGRNKRSVKPAPEVHRCTMCTREIKGPVYLLSWWRDGKATERSGRVCRECWLMVILPAGKA